VMRIRMRSRRRRVREGGAPHALEAVDVVAVALLGAALAGLPRLASLEHGYRGAVGLPLAREQDLELLRTERDGLRVGGVLEPEVQFAEGLRVPLTLEALPAHQVPAGTRITSHVWRVSALWIKKD